MTQYEKWKNFHRPMTVQNENTQPQGTNEKKKEDEITPLEKEEIEALKAYAMGTNSPYLFFTIT